MGVVFKAGENIQKKVEKEGIESIVGEMVKRIDEDITVDLCDDISEVMGIIDYYDNDNELKFVTVEIWYPWMRDEILKIFKIL